MERRLVLIRHAKSSQADPFQDDFDRPLNERGKRDAPFMGRRLKKAELFPDLILSSPAKRAKQTARKIAGALDCEKEGIRFLKQLYLCDASVFEAEIEALEDKVKTVFIVGHNPGITEFANQLTDCFRIDNMPAGAFVAASIKAERWQDFSYAEKEVILCEYPKKFL